jgi:hypothetical protein
MLTASLENLRMWYLIVEDSLTYEQIGLLSDPQAYIIYLLKNKLYDVLGPSQCVKIDL